MDTTNHTPGRRAVAVLAGLATVAALTVGCSDSGSLADPKGPKNNSAKATDEYGFVDVCRSFDAGAYTEVIDDPEPPKAETDVSDAEGGWSACSWALRSTVLSVQMITPDDPARIDGLWKDWTQQPGYGTWEAGNLDDADAWDKSDVQLTKTTKDNPAAAVVALQRGNFAAMVRCVVWDRAATSAELVKTAEDTATRLAEKSAESTKT